MDHMDVRGSILRTTHPLADRGHSGCTALFGARHGCERGEMVCYDVLPRPTVVRLHSTSLGGSLRRSRAGRSSPFVRRSSRVERDGTWNFSAGLKGMEHGISQLVLDGGCVKGGPPQPSPQGVNFSTTPAFDAVTRTWWSRPHKRPSAVTPRPPRPSNRRTDPERIHVDRTCWSVDVDLLSKLNMCHDMPQPCLKACFFFA